ncbi:uncharacterized protein LOC125586066 [Brassica napus]|uniref:uncharacterized protein LOC106320331 n=1 Tax=Brassica oleracea var. oleracea TaxID=109376 RepID=UPI0006A6D2A0|nr:PREDICTED: uncharacterized protein LOC106320331 [Brassica oleracea var. oleracea]XP_048611819.1 uncharacterized protein LOC125586066 [Brassica napus]
MVFVEGTKESIQGALAVFDTFAEWSGLTISIAKSTLYLAGFSENEMNNILSNFPFAKGDLPVRYLGLPLMTKVMRKQDYFPLVEKIRELKAMGAKVAWSVICQTNKEGGLGIRDLKVVNKVNVLKLIWRLFSGKSLWGKWIEANLLKRKCFWEIREKTQVGSWMWRKMLRMRDVARRFHMRELGNGRHISFWFDNWCEKGVMFSLLGEHGIVSMGISREATVEEAVMCVRRRRSHRS